MTSLHQPILADLKAAFTPAPMAFDSEEEEWFTWMLDELVEAGYCQGYERAQPITLFTGIEAEFFKKMHPKKGPQAIRKFLVRPQTYTPDVVCRWSEKAIKSVFLQCTLDPMLSEAIPFIHTPSSPMVSYFETKAKFDYTGNTNVGRILARWTCFANSIIVQEIQPGGHKNSFFDRFWTPRRFLVTKKLKQPRTLKFTPRSLPEFIAQTSAKLAGFLP